MLEGNQDVIDRARWVLPGVGHPLDLRIDGLSVQVDQVEYKVVCTPSLDIPGRQFGPRPCSSAHEFGRA